MKMALPPTSPLIAPPRSGAGVRRAFARQRGRLGGVTPAKSLREPEGSSHQAAGVSAHEWQAPRGRRWRKRAPGRVEAQGRCCRVAFCCAAVEQAAPRGRREQLITEAVPCRDGESLLKPSLIKEGFYNYVTEGIVLLTS